MLYGRQSGLSGSRRPAGARIFLMLLGHACIMRGLGPRGALLEERASAGHVGSWCWLVGQ